MELLVFHPHFTQNLEWLFENLLVATEESTFCTAQNKVSSTIVQDLGERHYRNVVSITIPLDRVIVSCAQVKHLLIKFYLSVSDRGIL